MAASLMNAREFAASLSYRVATRRHCLILLKTRSAKLRARHRYGLKQIGSLRFRFGGMFGPRTVFTGECSDPVRVVSSINKQHRSASNIDQQATSISKQHRSASNIDQQATSISKQHRA
jgi:hypothetical protein